MNKKNERIAGIIQIIFAVAIVIVVLVFSNEIEKLREFGYLGVFIISVLASATLFIPAPGWAIVIVMARVLDPILVGITAGVGSAIGELTAYAAGSGAAKLLHSNSHFKKFKGWIKRNDLLAIFILAAIPNPLFDVAGIAAGSLGIKWWRYLISTAAGRTLRYILLAYLGAFSLQFI